MIKRLKASFTS